MRSTSSRRPSDSPRERFPRSAAAAVSITAPLVSILLVCVSCSPLPRVEPAFEGLRPSRILVALPKNETTRAISEVHFGGFGQRHTLGAHVFDFQRLLRQAIVASLEAKGYETVLESAPSETESDGQRVDWAEPLPDGAERPAFDAYLRVAIEAWSGRLTAPLEFEMRYRIELNHVPTGQPLYSGAFSARGAEERSAPGQTKFIRTAVRRSTRRATEPLPFCRRADSSTPQRS